MFVLLSAALYCLPDGTLYSWRLSLRGTVARLWRPPDPRQDAAGHVVTDHRDLLDILHQQHARLADMRRRLAEIGVTGEHVENMKLIAGRVVRLGQGNSLDTFTIDVGTADGVLPGQACVVGQAVAGIVVRTEENASLVLNLASPGCYVSARLGEPGGSIDRPRLLCGVRGAGAGVVSSVIFSTDSPAKEGWIAMTSGLEPLIPEGLILGTVAGRMVEGEENGTLEAELRPATDLTSIDFVTVLARE
jgi:cell shape-determining protein MreC